MTQFGFVPVTADDMVAPGDTVIAKIDALISRAPLMVVDASSDYTVQELRLALKQIEFSRILVVTPAGVSLPVDIVGATVLQRPDIASADPEDFLDRLSIWLSTAEQEYAPTLTDEPNRLLQASEYRAAIIAAITLLESTLRDRYKQAAGSFSRPTPLKALLEMARE